MNSFSTEVLKQNNYNVREMDCTLIVREIYMFWPIRTLMNLGKGQNVFWGSCQPSF